MTTFDVTAEYPLENDVALLRPLSPDDLPALVRFVVEQPEIWRYSYCPPVGEDGMKAYFETALAARAAGREYPFAVIDKRTGRFAGSTRFYDINIANRSLQLGYTWYAGEFQGTGLNKNCKFLLLECAFDACGFDRVEFQADVNNARSIAAMKSIGCTVEGVLRSHLLRPDGTRRDSIVLSILRREWQEGLRERLRGKL